MEQMLDVILVVVGLVGRILLGFSSWVSWQSYQFVRQHPKRELHVQLGYAMEHREILGLRVMNVSHVTIVIMRIELDISGSTVTSQQLMKVSERLVLKREMAQPILMLKTIDWADWNTDPDEYGVDGRMLAEILRDAGIRIATIRAFLWDETGKRYDSNPLRVDLPESCSQAGSSAKKVVRSLKPQH